MKIPKNIPKQLPNGFRQVTAGETIQGDDVVTDKNRKPTGLVVGVGKHFATVFNFESRDTFRVFKVLQSGTVVCNGHTYAIWRQ